MHLGLSDDEFFSLTPRQLNALFEQQREAIEHRELLAGIVAATIANYSLGAPKTPAVPRDFMPSRARSEAPSPRQRMSRASVARNLSCFLQAHRLLQEQKLVNETT